MRNIGLEGTLALKNFKRNKKIPQHYTFLVLGGIVLFISTSALTADMKQNVESADRDYDYDIIFPHRSG